MSSRVFRHELNGMAVQQCPDAIALYAWINKNANLKLIFLAPRRLHYLRRTNDLARLVKRHAALPYYLRGQSRILAFQHLYGGRLCNNPVENLYYSRIVGFRIKRTY